MPSTPDDHVAPLAAASVRHGQTLDRSAQPYACSPPHRTVTAAAHGQVPGQSSNSRFESPTHGQIRATLEDRRSSLRRLRCPPHATKPAHGHRTRNIPYARPPTVGLRHSTPHERPCLCVNPFGNEARVEGGARQPSYVYLPSRVLKKSAVVGEGLRKVSCDPSPARDRRSCAILTRRSRSRLRRRMARLLFQHPARPVDCSPAVNAGVAEHIRMCRAPWQWRRTVGMTGGGAPEPCGGAQSSDPTAQPLKVFQGNDLSSCHRSHVKRHRCALVGWCFYA